MKNELIYDCIIVGGGLAGLALAILLAEKKRTVLLIEKKSYPYHKVCGEYVSNESYHFLEKLGIPLSQLNLPSIKQLLLTSIKGESVFQDLDLGGFGISRYQLDEGLASIARSKGVSIMENTTAINQGRNGDLFEINTSKGLYLGRIISGAFGRHSFGNFYKSKRLQENWVGIKYHVKYSLQDKLVSLHNFNGGYCGISKIENEKCCLCYLVKSSVLVKYANDIKRLEKEVLQQNPYLKAIFENAEFLFEKPLTISNISFSVKKPVYEHVFYVGDSAGAIAPLSGNGMSNALRSSDILAKCLNKYFDNHCTFSQLEADYSNQWEMAFKNRINSGRWIQYFFCKQYLTSFFVFMVKHIKPLRLFVLKQTHGQPF